MEDNYLKEVVCLARTLNVLDQMIESDNNLVVDFAKLIELKEQNKVHTLMQAVGTSSAIFCLGATISGVCNNDFPNEIYAWITGVLGSSAISLVSGNLKWRTKWDANDIYEEVKNGMMRLMSTEFDVGITKLSGEEKERFFQILVATVLQDKGFKKKIKRLNKCMLNFNNNNDEMV
jgi:hypothetical protein